MLLGHETAAPKATTSTERPQECKHTMGFGPLQQQDYSLLLQKPSEKPTKSEAMAATRILWAFSLGSGGKVNAP